MAMEGFSLSTALCSAVLPDLSRALTSVSASSSDFMAFGLVLYAAACKTVAPESSLARTRKKESKLPAEQYIDSFDVGVVTCGDSPC